MARLDTGKGIFGAFDLRAETYLLRLRDARDERPRTEAAIAARATLGLGKLF